MSASGSLSLRATARASPVIERMLERRSGYGASNHD